MAGKGAEARGDPGPVVAPVLREKAAVAAGDTGAYFGALSQDAVFMPPNSPAKSGEELRSWLTAFLRDFRIEWLDFTSTEIAVAGDMAYHAYTYTWRATARSGGEGRVSSGQGLHILRQQPDGSWRISREIWNSVPG